MQLNCHCVLQAAHTFYTVNKLCFRTLLSFWYISRCSILTRLLYCVSWINGPTLELKRAAMCTVRPCFSRFMVLWLCLGTKPTCCDLDFTHGVQILALWVKACVCHWFKLSNPDMDTFALLPHETLVHPCLKPKVTLCNWVGCEQPWPNNYIWWDGQENRLFF